MNDKQVDRILDGLGQLADKLGQTAAHLWGVLVQQAILGGIRYLVWATLCLVGFGLLAKPGRRVIRNQDYSCSDNQSTALIVAWLGLVVLAISATGLVLGGLNRLLNPEYYALQELLRQVSYL